MENALSQVHKTPAWQELVRRNIYEDVFMGSAEFTKFLRVRMEEYRGFYDAIGLDKMK
jgi:tripartite-type tricarboxylate transporter receptor subunit TctC